MNIMTNRIRALCFISSILLSVSQAVAQSTKNVVTGINAESTSGKTVTVSWESPEDSSSVSTFLVYREKQPLTSWTQIENMEPVAILNGDETSYTDSLRTSQEYYYAIITVVSPSKRSNPGLYYDEQIDDSAESRSDETIIKTVLPGVNATVNGARIKTSKNRSNKTVIQKREPTVKEYKNGELRETPLPYIDVLDEKPAHESTISNQSKEKAKTLIKGSGTYKRDPLPVHIFEEDLVSPAGGDEYLLFEILKTYFIKKQYTESITALRKFLAQNRTKSVADRASFYLGESYYYTGNFPAALTRFLALEDTYPELTRRWIDSSLDLFN